MIDTHDTASLIDRTVRTTDGERIGTVGQLWVDADTGQVRWAGVETGLLGASQHLVPLHDAELESDEIVVPVTLDTVRSAPDVDPADDLTAEHEGALAAHYAIPLADADGAERVPAGGSRMLRWAMEGPAEDGTDGGEPEQPATDRIS